MFTRDFCCYCNKVPLQCDSVKPHRAPTIISFPSIVITLIGVCVCHAKKSAIARKDCKDSHATSKASDGLFAAETKTFVAYNQRNLRGVTMILCTEV